MQLMGCDRRTKKTTITGSDNPTGEETQNGAQMATQSNIGAELGASPGHDSETEAFN
jgi:hypothetical protein